MTNRARVYSRGTTPTERDRVMHYILGLRFVAAWHSGNLEMAEKFATAMALISPGGCS